MGAVLFWAGCTALVLLLAALAVFVVVETVRSAADIGAHANERASLAQASSALTAVEEQAIERLLLQAAERPSVVYGTPEDLGEHVHRLVLSAFRGSLNGAA